MVKCKTAELEKLISFFKYKRDFSVYECFSKFSCPFLIIPPLYLAGHESSWNVFRTWQTCCRRKQDQMDERRKRSKTEPIPWQKIEKWTNKRKRTISGKRSEKISADVDRQDRHKRKQQREVDSLFLLTLSLSLPSRAFTPSLSLSISLTLTTAHERNHRFKTMLVSVRKMSEIYELWKKK